MAKIAVAGGTGLVGGAVVRLLERAGHEAVVLSRSTGVDLVSGAGLEPALVGCDAVVDVSNVATGEAEVATAFFSAEGRELSAVAHAAGVRNLVVLSIVGVDVVDLGYFLGKRTQEEAVVAGPAPWTILRATQFHEFPATTLLPTASDGVLPVPPMVCRPVAVDDVADRLVELAMEEARGFVTELAGPEEITMPEMVRAILAATGSDLVVEVLDLPEPLLTQVRTLLVPQGTFDAGTTTFADHVAACHTSHHPAGHTATS